MSEHEYDVRWRCWSQWDRPDTVGRLYENRAGVDMPTGSEIAACVVWQMAANNDRGVGLWTEDTVIVEIVEPIAFAGHYAVSINIKVETTGREMPADEIKELYEGVH